MNNVSHNTTQSRESEIAKHLECFSFEYIFEEIIGEGTFSTVFKARNRNTGMPVAIKAITKTSAPNRVSEELSILKKLDGRENCIKLYHVMRYEDQIIAVFPLRKSIDFFEFIERCDIMDIKEYMHNLLVAVRHIHANGIIHRDIKPGNFLYDYENKEGVLIDFGLAQAESEGGEAPKKREEKKPIMLFNTITIPIRAPGYYTKDTRPAMKAPRAGTRGFRAPEVLFKCSHQTRAIDMWSVGVIFLSLMTRQYPFFISKEDIDGIVEMSLIYGDYEMRKAAKIYGKIWKTNIETIPGVQTPFDEVVMRLNPGLAFPSSALDLLRRLLDLNYETRITAEQALEHPFFDTDASFEMHAPAK